MDTKTAIEVAAATVVEAWDNAGLQPASHRKAQAELHRTWPVLARAVEGLVATQKRSQKNVR